MEVSPNTIRSYITRNGKSPFSEWFASLKDAKGRAKIRIRLDRVRLGNFGDSKHVGHQVHELRLDFGPGYRIYYGLDGRDIVILLIGGEKHGQSKDIRLAQEYWMDYRSR